MEGLSNRIMERFASGEVLTRAELKLGADYDSVGRVLAKLVDERKLERVARGHYRIARAKSARPPATIADAIKRRLARSRRNVFLRSDFTSLGSYDAVGRALRRKTEEGELVQIGYGLYAKAARSPITGKPAPVVGIRKLATEALARLGKEVEASDSETAYNLGRSTQVPTGRSLTIKDRVTRRIGYGSNYVTLKRA